MRLSSESPNATQRVDELIVEDISKLSESPLSAHVNTYSHGVELHCAVKHVFETPHVLVSTSLPTGDVPAGLVVVVVVVVVIVVVVGVVDVEAAAVGADELVLLADVPVTALTLGEIVVLGNDGEGEYSVRRVDGMPVQKTE
jgi:hypothetical protein